MLKKTSNKKIWNEFLDYLKYEKKMKLNTTLSYERDLLKFFEFSKENGAVNFKDTTEFFNKYMENIRKEKSASTVSRNIASLRRFFKFLYDKRIKGIRLSTRPDYIDDKILSNLKEKNVTTIELGVQSMNDNVLLMNKRGLKSEDTVNAVKKIKEYGFSLGLQMMVGMYGSTEEDDILTAKKLIELKPQFVRIYPTVVIKETELYKLYKSGQYLPYSLDKAVDVCSKLLNMFEDNGIKVIRLGLMAGEEINENNVYGPYHSSFRELTESKIYYDKIKEQIKALGYKDVVISCKNKLTSKIIGNRRRNIVKLKNELELNSIVVVNEDVDEFVIREGKV